METLWPNYWSGPVPPLMWTWGSRNHLEVPPAPQSDVSRVTCGPQAHSWLHFRAHGLVNDSCCCCLVSETSTRRRRRSFREDLTRSRAAAAAAHTRQHWCTDMMRWDDDDEIGCWSHYALDIHICISREETCWRKQQLVHGSHIWIWTHQAWDFLRDTLCRSHLEWGVRW